MTTKATHLSDSELLRTSDSGCTDGRDLRRSSHLRECSTCQERLVEIEQLLDDAGPVTREDAIAGGQHADRRARLTRALSDAADDWQRSWWFRLRMTLGGARVWLMVPAMVVLMVATVSLFERSSVPSPVHATVGADTTSLPIASLTPGAVTTLTTRELCDGQRPSHSVSAAVRAQVVRAYRMEGVSENAYELDALITPELGGSTDRANLWPQRYDAPVWNARVKDQIERLLPQLVCEGRVDLTRAQHEIAADWIGAYKKYFATDRPLLAHITGPMPPDDDQEITVDEPPVVRVALRQIVTEPRVLISRTP